MTKVLQCCFLNANEHIRWLNVPFQPNINVETTLDHQHWINVTLSTLFQRCFVNVETTSINVRRLDFHFQPNINIETTLMNVDDQLCFNLIQRWCVCWVKTTFKDSNKVKRIRNYILKCNLNLHFFDITIVADFRWKNDNISRT